MPNNTSQADHLKRWDMALVAGETNSDEPGVSDLRDQLASAAAGVRGCIARRNLLKYQLQQNSREMDGFLAFGREVFSRLMLVVKGRYGWKSEKLVEWGGQPQRPAVKVKPTPTEDGQSPAQAAHSQTDSAS